MVAPTGIDSDYELDSITDGTISDIHSNYEDDEERQTRQDHVFAQSSAAAQAAKAIEVAQNLEESGRSSMDTTPLLTFASSFDRQGWDEPVLDAGPAPPDYAAATSSRPLDFRDRGPQSMVDVFQDNSGHNHPQISGTFARTLGTKGRRRSRFRLVLSIVVFFLVILSVIWRRTRGPKAPSMPLLYSNEFLKEKNMDARCMLDNYLDFIDIPFENPESFSFIEDMGWVECGPNFTGCTLGGYFDVTVISATDTTESVPQNIPMMVRIGIATAWPFKIDKINYLKTNDSLVLQKPDLTYRATEPSDSHQWNSVYENMTPCLDVNVRILVRRNVEFTNWVTKLRHFRVGGAKGPDDENATKPTFHAPPFRVSNTTFFQNHHGPIDTVGWISRNTHVQTRTSNIGGDFRFGETLTLESFSGNITSIIKSDNTYSTPGKGDVRKLTTITRSGNTVLDCWRSWGWDMTPETPLEQYLPHVAASHSTSSGKIALKYSSRWAGVIEGMSVYGKVGVRGIESEFDREPNGESVQISVDVGGDAARASDASHTQFSTETGDVDIVIGAGLDWSMNHFGWCC